MGCVTLMAYSASMIRNQCALHDEVIDCFHVWLLNGAAFANRVLILHAKGRKFLRRSLNILWRKSFRIGRNVQVANYQWSFRAFGCRRVRTACLRWSEGEKEKKLNKTKRFISGAGTKRNSQILGKNHFSKPCFCFIFKKNHSTFIIISRRQIWCFLWANEYSDWKNSSFDLIINLFIWFHRHLISLK